MFDPDALEITSPSHEVIIYTKTVGYIEDAARRAADHVMPKTLFLVLAMEFCRMTIEDLEVCNQIWDFTVVTEMERVL
jgi:hypothetical protein